MGIFRKRKDEVRIENAGKEPLDDDILPEGGKPVRQRMTGGEVPDTAGKHGDMAVETADALARRAEERKER